MTHPRPSLTLADVDRELSFAGDALDRMDYTTAFDHLTTAREYPDRVPVAGASEYALVAFAAADERLEAAHAVVERGHGGGREALINALRSLRPATAQFD
jgi:hypothetical protein